MDWIARPLAGPWASAGSRRTATRKMPGAICLSSSSHFALILYSHGKAGGVAAGLRKALDEASANGIRGLREHDRDGAGGLQ